MLYEKVVYVVNLLKCAFTRNFVLILNKCSFTFSSLYNKIYSLLQIV
jgi:hypothetical protein